MAASGAGLFLWCAFGDDYERMMTPDLPDGVGDYLRNTLLALLGMVVALAGVGLAIRSWRDLAAERVRRSSSIAEHGDRPPPEIAGSEAVRSWFGEWPDFHDAEIREIKLVPEGESTIKLLAYLLRNGSEGEAYLVPYKHAEVSFSIRGITGIRMEGQNAWGLDDSILELALTSTDGGYRLVLSDMAGYDTTIEASKMSVSVEPMKSEMAGT